MRTTILGVALSVVACPLAAQVNTDVFLAPLSVEGGRLVVGKPVNVTNRPGYDNQPSFTPDGRAILYTSVRDDAQADIYRYDLASRTIARLTTTPESEYSAVVTPNGKRFSVIRVERDSTQRLWSFRLDGSDPQLVIQNLKPVGYQAWVGDHTLALFVLGSPNALVVADTRTGVVDTVTRNIGRSLVPLPGSRGYSYTQRMPDSTWALMRVAGSAPGRDKGSEFAPLPRGADYVVWVTPDRPVTGVGSRLLEWNASGRGWMEIADLTAAGLARISRLAVSPDGRWIAIVAEPAAR